MYSILNLKKNLIAGLVLSGSVAVSLSAASLTKSGIEYPILPSLPRDQVVPHLSLGPGGGYLVAQDSTVDGNGLGIRARRIFSDLSGFRTTFLVNSQIQGDQQNAKVAVLQNGGAVFSWQSSTASGHRIFVRFLGANDTFTAPEIPASELQVGHQSDASVAVLKDGSVVVVWAEWNRDGSMQGIYGQQFSADGQRNGPTFQVNTVTYLNQRTPAIAALESGGFVVAWVSDEFRQRGSEYIDIAARIFGADGAPAGNDFALNSRQEICANPAVAATADGFRAAWSSRFIDAPTFVRKASNDVSVVNGTLITNEVNVVSPPVELSTESWNVSTRFFNSQGIPSAAEVAVNSTRKGDQFSPRLAHYGNRELVLWTSFGQDGSDEGIYGRVVFGSDFEGDEFLVNMHTSFGQRSSTVAALGDKVVVAWSSFLGAAPGFDIVAQQFTISGDESLVKPEAPFVSSISQKSISVTWAEIGAQPVDVYRVYVDDETTPVETIGGMIAITRDHWTPGSSHSVRLSYRLQDGRISPPSDAVAVVTWGADENSDGIPDDWQRENWGKVWPAAATDTDGDGASNLAEFLAGTDPTDAASVLKVQISPREQGVYIQWQTLPGSYYQVQVTSNFTEWTDIGTARFAPSASDAVPMESTGTTKYYRVIRMH